MTAYKAILNANELSGKCLIPVNIYCFTQWSSHNVPIELYTL